MQLVEVYSREEVKEFVIQRLHLTFLVSVNCKKSGKLKAQSKVHIGKEERWSKNS